MMISRIIHIIIVLFFTQVINTEYTFTQQYGHWEIIDSTNLPRRVHASVVMADGNVMVTGGLTRNNLGYSSSVEIFSVVSNTWNIIDSMHHSRGNHKMVLLNDGRILVIGGYNQNSCEVYNPAIGLWEFTDSLNFQRDWQFTATTLPNGEVLVVGGMDIEVNPPGLYTLKSCEIFNPETDNWRIVDSLEIERKGHTATVLADGRVLVAGGDNSSGSIENCEIFDPETGLWSVTGSLNIERDHHSGLLLPNNKVLIAGGGNSNSLALFSCELFDPVTEIWVVVGFTAFPHFNHSSILLADSLIMLVGGAIGPASWELFNPKTFSSVIVNTLPFDKYESTVQLLPDDRLINIGGWWRDGMYVITTEVCLMYYPNTTAIASTQDKLTGFSLEQNYPNPFNPSTTIKYTLKENGIISLKVYDILGRDIVILINEFQLAGSYTITFNASTLVSGIYVYKLQVNDFIQTKKMIIAR